MKRKLATAVASVGLIAACSEAPTVPEAIVSGESAPALARADYVPGEVLVKFKSGATGAARLGSLRLARGVMQEEIATRTMGRRSYGGIAVVRTELDVPEAIAQLVASGQVEYAEPNWIYNHSATSNDSYYTNGSLWGMYGDASSPANQFGSQAAEAWAAGKTNCSNVYVGIIDEGYMHTHGDLAGSVGTNPGEVAGNGVDDDGNGYVDDVYGWDFDGGNNSVFDGINDDHGTHVAGTIGATGGNGTGVVGVCWGVKLLNAKFLGNRGGTTANAIKAVDYFTDMKLRHGINLVATSNSWGGGGFSQGLQDAIERANAAGILFIAAAGNDALNCQTYSCYPAEYPNANVISVASITSSGGMSSFSNYGSSTIDLGAPGSAIYSTVPRRVSGNIVAGYASYSGTSMATPHVSGAAALYAAYHPGSTAAQIKSAILGSVVPTASLSGKTLTGGRLNVSGF